MAFLEDSLPYFLLRNNSIEVGGMDYGFEMHGILGMDFLTQAGAMINLREMTIAFTN